MTTTRWRTWFVSAVALALLTMVLATAGVNAVAAAPAPSPAPTPSPVPISTTAAGSGGASWQWHHTELDGVACWSSADCLAVGKGFQAQRTSDGGATWVQHDPGVAQLSGLACPSGPTCIAVGQSPTGGRVVARTTDGGATWASDAATVGPSIACLSSTVCVSPIDSATVARTTDGGLSWNSVATGVATPTAPAEWAACAATTCVVAGSTGTILQTGDDGLTWSSTAPAITPTVISSLACSSTRCLLLGVVGYSDSVTLTSGDGGATWTTFHNYGGLGPAACASDTRCLAGGGSKVTDDGGATWQASAPVAIDGVTFGLTCGAGICAAVARSGAIATSSDTGTTWSASRAGLALNAKAVSCPTASRCVALRTSGGGALTSADGGASWTAAAGLTWQDLVSCAPGTAHCVAASSSTSSMVAVSDDFGVTWTPSAGWNRFALSCPNPQRCTSFSSTSFDGGWSFVPAENVGVAFALSCPTATHCVGVATSSTVTSDDGGLTWTTRYSPLGPLRRVSCASATECLAMGDAPSPGQPAVVIGSHDGGVSWTARTAPTGAQTLSSLSCATSTDCVAAGSVAGADDAIFRSADGGSTWSIDVAMPTGIPYSTYETGTSCTATTRCVLVGDGVWTLGAPVTPAPSEVPGPPIGVTATAGAGSATVNWSAPAPNGSAPVTGYEVTALPSGRTMSVSKLGPVVVPGLAAGASVSFTVTAVGPLGSGPASASSNVVVPTSGLPAAPVSFYAYGTDKAIALYWGVPPNTGGSPITDYIVTVTPGNVVSHTGAATSTTIPGLTNGVAYSATVVAVNAQGSGPVASLSGAYPHVNPGPITGMLASAGDGSAFVTWNPIPDGGAPIEGGMLSVWNGNDRHDVWMTGTPQPTVVTGLTNGVTYQTSLNVWTGRGWSSTGVTGPAVTPKVGATFGARYHPLTPTRVLDSRGPTGGWNARLTAGSPRDLQVTGLGGVSSVPATASAVVLNVTATNSTAGSFLSVWPTGSAPPVSSNLNFAAGETIANLVTVKVGAGGTLRFADAVGATDVVADLVGYYDDGTQPGDRFTSILPERALDTRGPHLTPPYTRLVAGFPHDLPLAGHGSVPSTATAVVANVTVTDATAGSFLTVWPAGSPKPTSSSLNFAAGETIANLVVMPLGTGGAISLADAVGATDVIVDVVGYFDPNSGATFHALAPVRVLDDRVGTGASGPWGPGTTRAVAVGGVGTVPSGATAIVGNLTATNASLGSFVTAFPHGSPRPISSTVNFGPHQTIPNALITGLHADEVDLANELGSVDLVLDVAGYFAAP